MSISYKEIDVEEFKSTVATITCDKTGLKMIEIIVKPSERKHVVKVQWKTESNPSSGSHEIEGDVFFSPIETVTQKTAIIGAISKEKEGVIHHLVGVKKIK